MGREQLSKKEIDRIENMTPDQIGRLKKEMSLHDDRRSIWKDLREIRLADIILLSMFFIIPFLLMMLAVWVFK